MAARKNAWNYRRHPTNTVCGKSAFLFHPTASHKLAGWDHNSNSPQPPLLEEGKHRGAATLTLCVAQPASCHVSQQTCRTLPPACQRCRGSAALHSRSLSPGLWEKKESEQAAWTHEWRAMGLEVLSGRLTFKQVKLLQAH